MEFLAFGTSQKERVQRFEENIIAIKRLWTEDVVDMKGSHFELKGASAATKPVQKPHPPIWIATWTAAPRAARRVALHADGWQASGLHSAVDALPDGIGHIEKACAEIGRDPEEIGRAYVNTIVEFGATPDDGASAVPGI